jgi:elongation factor P
VRRSSSSISKKSACSSSTGTTATTSWISTRTIKSRSPRKKSGEARDFLKENTEVEILFIEDSPVTVELPNFIEIRIAKTDPGIRGDTASGGSKPATLETGAVIQVPLFLNEGDVVKVDTRSGDYLGRVATAG